MIYGKIFLNDEGKLIFDAVPKYVRFHVYPAVPYVDENGVMHSYKTVTVTPVDCIAISREAKEKILEKFQFRNEKLTVEFNGVLQFIRYPRSREGEYGVLVFVPDEGKPYLTVDPEGILRVDRTNGFYLSVVNYMQVFDNAFLEKLDLSEPYGE